MSPRIKKGSPMKYHGFYCDDELWKEMQKAAIELDESDSEYIRKAVDNRNKFEAANTSIEELDSTHKVDPLEKHLDHIHDTAKKMLKDAEKPMVHPIPKGGK